MKVRGRQAGLIIMLAMGAGAACNDGETTDARGYTKAPLERASVVIRPEGSSAMDSLGSPVLPRDTMIEPPAAAASTTK